jgi:ribose transport system permease protein
MTTFAAINPDFIRPANLAVIARGMTLVGIVTIGMALCMIGGMVDISVGSTAGLTGSMFVMGLVIWEIHPVLAIGAAIATGAVFGLINYTLIIRGKMNPFIVTIATMFVGRGLTSYITGGRTIYPLPDGWSQFANAQPLGLSWLFFAFVALLIVAQLALSTVWGLQLRATGSDREIAKCTEVDADKMTMQTFIIIGALAAVAGILGSMRFNGAQPLLGQGWEFQALAACAIGGISIYGYEGSLVGAFLGLATMQVLANGLVAIGLSPYLQVVAIGIALCLAMMVDARRRITFDLDAI